MAEGAHPHVERLYWLDLLRWLAALLVVVSHLRQVLFPEYVALPEADRTLAVTLLFGLSRMSHEAVLFFFVLSGFLVGGGVVRRVVEGRFRPGAFAVDRAVRIYLPLIPALALTGLVDWASYGDTQGWVLLGNLFALQGAFVPVYGGNVPLWTLSYEIWFYLLALAAGMVAVRRGFHPGAVMLFGVGLAFLTLLDLTYLLCWLIGTLAALFRPTCLSLARVSVALVIMAWGSLAIQAYQASDAVDFGALEALILPLNPGSIAFCLGAALLLRQIVLLQPKRPFARGLHRGGTWLAASSYTLYLTHHAWLNLAVLAGLSQAATVNAVSVMMFAGVLAGLVVLGWLMALPFERQTDRVRRLIKGRLRYA